MDGDVNIVDQTTVKPSSYYVDFFIFVFLNSYSYPSSSTIHNKNNRKIKIL